MGWEPDQENDDDWETAMPMDETFLPPVSRGIPAICLPAGAHLPPHSWVHSAYRRLNCFLIHCNLPFRFPAPQFSPSVSLFWLRFDDHHQSGNRPLFKLLFKTGAIFRTLSTELPVSGFSGMSVMPKWKSAIIHSGSDRLIPFVIVKSSRWKSISALKFRAWKRCDLQQGPSKKRKKNGIPIGMRTLFFNSPSKISFYGCFSCFQVPKSRNCDPFVPHLCPRKEPAIPIKYLLWLDFDRGFPNFFSTFSS